MRGLAVDETLRREIVTRGGIPPLLALTHSEDVEVQQECLSCLCNLSLSGCVGDNPLEFVEAIDVHSLVSFLCSADTTYRLFGAVVLGNIASDLSHHEEIIEGGALAPLIA